MIGRGWFKQTERKGSCIGTGKDFCFFSCKLFAILSAHRLQKKLSIPLLHHKYYFESVGL